MGPVVEPLKLSSNVPLGPVMLRAWRSGLAPGTQVLAVDGFAFDADLLKSAIRSGTRSGEPLELIVREGARFRTVRIDYHGGLRYPHLVRDASRAALLDQILAPRN